jgi:hypothetical protein
VRRDSLTHYAATTRARQTGKKQAVGTSRLDGACSGDKFNIQFGRIHFKPQPRADRAYGPGGKLNHAFGQEEPKPKATAVGVQQQEYVNGRKNHAYTPPEDAAKRVAIQASDAWQEIIDLHVKVWSTPGQQVKLQNELNAGLAAGKSRRDIAASLAAMIRDQQRGR